MNSKVKTNFNILAILSIILFCFALSPITLQNDTYYTIKIGEHVLQNGVDMMDPFSWHENLPYTYPHWLYDVATFLVYQAGGFLGIYIATVVLACILGILVYITNVKLSKNHLVSFIITLGVIYMLRGYIAARAQLVTFILFVITILFIELFLETKKKRYAAGLVIIPILIANLHLAVWPFYFVLFLPYIAEYLICLAIDSDGINRMFSFAKKKQLKRLQAKVATLEKAEKIQEKIVKTEKKIQEYDDGLRKTRENRAKRRANPYRLILKKNPVVKWLIVVVILCLFTGLLTPLQGTPYTYLKDTMEGNTTKSISEHQPLTLINSKDFMCILVVMLAMLIFTDTKITMRDLFMLGGLLLLTFISRRQMSMYVLIGSFIFTKMISNLFAKYDPEGTKNVMGFMATWVGKILVICTIVVLSLYFLRPKRGDEFVSTSTYPVDAAQYIIDNIDMENMKLYNEYNYGSYLLYRGIPVFIDSRADLYAPEFNKKNTEDGNGRDIFSDYINISSINTYYEDKFKQYGITHAIMVKNAKLNMFISRDPNYKQLYADDHFVIYERLNVNEAEE